MNAATVSIQREGAEGQIHICEGANTYFKNNSKRIFLYLRECEYRPHMHVRKNELLKIFPACIGFVPGGNEGGPRGQNRHILVGFLNWLGAFLAPGPSPSPLVRQVCEHPAFCVTSSALFRQNSGRFQSFIRQFAWALFRYFQTILGNFRQSWLFLVRFPGQKPRLTKKQRRLRIAHLKL